MTKDQYMRVIETIINSPRNDIQKITMLKYSFETYVEEHTVTEFAKYLREQSFLCDSNDWHSFNAIDVDDLDDFVKEFLESK